MINQVYVKLNTYEFNRYFKWVSDGFMKSIRPFIFRDEMVIYIVFIMEMKMV